MILYSAVGKFAADARSRRAGVATYSKCLEEYDASNSSQLTINNLQMEFIRGEGMGGGVGGMVYSIKKDENGNPEIICSHANHRGDVIARSDTSGSLTSFALYEAYGTRPYEWGSDPDRQKANTKEEETDLGLLNEGMRYRDLETGVFLTRDPIGYKDGPNVYCYVHCNPITSFDPLGLSFWSNVWKGDFDSAETTWGGIGGQVGVGLIPVVGQIADARDTVANVKNVWENPKSKGAWAGLGGAAIAWVPGVGVALKGLFKVGKKVAIEGGQKLIKEGGQQLIKEGSQQAGKEMTQAAAKTANEAAEIVSEEMGVVYRRVDRTGTLAPYGGQAKSEKRFFERISEHQKKYPDADFEFEIVGRAKPGLDLDILEHNTIQGRGGRKRGQPVICSVLFC